MSPSFLLDNTYFAIQFVDDLGVFVSSIAYNKLVGFNRLLIQNAEVEYPIPPQVLAKRLPSTQVLYTSLLSVPRTKILLAVDESMWFESYVIDLVSDAPVFQLLGECGGSNEHKPYTTYFWFATPNFFILNHLNVPGTTDDSFLIYDYTNGAFVRSVLQPMREMTVLEVDQGRFAYGVLWNSQQVIKLSTDDFSINATYISPASEPRDLVYISGTARLFVICDTGDSIILDRDLHEIKVSYTQTPLTNVYQLVGFGDWSFYFVVSEQAVSYIYVPELCHFRCSSCISSMSPPNGHGCTACVAGYSLLPGLYYCQLDCQAPAYISNLTNDQCVPNPTPGDCVVESGFDRTVIPNDFKYTLSPGFTYSESQKKCFKENLDLKPEV